MQKILSAAQTRAADAFTIKEQKIDSIDLMERAAQAFVAEFLKSVLSKSSVTVLCGPGNNGGDGLAISRLLLNAGFHVDAYLIDNREKLSADCHTNLERLEALTAVRRLHSAAELTLSSEMVIDAIFGSGLNRPVSGFIADIINKVNQSELPVVSVDIPSGLSADEVLDTGAVIEAHFTICFQLPKLSFLIPETGRFVGEWKAVDIGLSSAFISRQEGLYHLVDAQSVASLLPVRQKFAHKGVYGRVQLVAGSLGKMGAAALCGEAIMRSGAGLLTIHVPRVGLNPIQSLLREAMATVDIRDEYISNVPKAERANVICTGPGLGTHGRTAEALEVLLSGSEVPMVLDADALNIIAQKPGLIPHIPQGSVLTPHLGEFDRLFGKQANGLVRIEKIREFALANQLIVVLKGAHSAIVDSEGEVYFNTTGNAGMATAGSGDVLAGVITGLMAQGLGGREAAMAGVFIHGLAGDLARKEVGKTSLMASNLLYKLPEAFSNVTIASLFQKNTNFN